MRSCTMYPTLFTHARCGSEDLDAEATGPADACIKHSQLEYLLNTMSLSPSSTSSSSFVHVLPARKMSTKVRVGAVQGEPVWLNLEGSVGKTISLIKQAAADGVQVLGFPEVWIPGYPWYTPRRNALSRELRS